MDKANAENLDYAAYESLLRRVHGLIREGRGDSEEADSLRDQMDAPWSRLNDAERATLDRLSVELYEA